MKKNLMKKMMALAIAIMTIATNSVAASAETFNLHYTAGAPSTDNNISDLCSARATGGSYMRLVCTSFSQSVDYGSVTVTCSRYPISSTRFAASCGINMTYTGAIPANGETVTFNLALNNYISAKYISAIGYIGN